MKITIFVAILMIIPISLAFGQIQDSIVVTTDKSSYSEGETILVTGEVRELYSGTPVNIIIKAPNGNLVSIAKVIVGADKKFSSEATAGGSLMKASGTYTVNVDYGTKNRSAQTTFYFEGVYTNSNYPDSSVISDGKASVQGTNNIIEYQIKGGHLIVISEDLDFVSLIFGIDMPTEGTIIIELPRSVLDSKFNNMDDEFIILVDGDDVTHFERNSSLIRTLTIPLKSGSEEIEIIGSSINNKSAQKETAPTGYMGNVGSEGQTGSYTLEEALEIQKQRIAAVEGNANPTDNVLKNENIRLQNQILFLENENSDVINDNFKLKADNKKLQNKNKVLELKIDELQDIINEQIKVILETLKSLKLN